MTRFSYALFGVTTPSLEGVVHKKIECSSIKRATLSKSVMRDRRYEVNGRLHKEAPPRLWKEAKSLMKKDYYDAIFELSNEFPGASFSIDGYKVEIFGQPPPNTTLPVDELPILHDSELSVIIRVLGAIDRLTIEP
ncbi:hypothetical protein LJC07_02705 [Christensenellaceae bacterium OttesenSCG-928-L17]|nr:hypothetical protein [Christensenellaceae bacterium OttesenSCG-928-L17]